MSIRSREHERQKRKKRLLKVALFSAIFIFIFGGLAFIARRPSLRISSVQLSGEILLRPAEVEQATLSFLSGNYLFFYPKNSAALYPRKALEKYLLKTFPRIDSIDVRLSNAHTLAISVRERKPDSLWCGSTNLPTTAVDSVATSTNDTSQNLVSSGQETTSSPTPNLSPCYFLDDLGIVFAEAPNFSGDAYFKYLGPLQVFGPAESPLGGLYLASSSEFTALNGFIENLRSMNLEPAYLSVEDQDTYSIHLASGARILINPNSSLSDDADNLSTLIHSSSFATDTEALRRIDYIDLRFGNKLFYTWKK